MLTHCGVRRQGRALRSPERNERFGHPWRRWAVVAGLALGVSLAGCAGLDSTAARTDKPAPTDKTAQSGKAAPTDKTAQSGKAASTDKAAQAGSGPSGGPGQSGSTDPDAPAKGEDPARLDPAWTGSGEPIVLAFGGDVHFDGPLLQQLRDRPDNILSGVRPVLSEADIAIVNLESAIGTGGVKASKQFAFLAPDSAFDALSSSGVDVIGMANNHSLDYGQEGLQQTLAAISAKGAPVSGVGNNEQEAMAPRTFTIRGQTISVIVATQVLDSNLITDWTATENHPGVASAKRTESLLRTVSEARRVSDTVVVFLHWGTEKQHCPNDAQVTLSQSLATAGADIIVGGHAHRVQGAGYLGSSYVAYGLGNLQFKTSSEDARETGILTLSVTGRSVASPTWHPARIDGSYQPQLLQGEAAREAVSQWESYRECARLTSTPGGS